MKIRKPSLNLDMLHVFNRIVARMSKVNYCEYINQEIEWITSEVNCEYINQDTR